MSGKGRRDQAAHHAAHRRTELFILMRLRDDLWQVSMARLGSSFCVVELTGRMLRL
jgi:hypothetical protein